MMLSAKIDETNGIAILEPDGPLSKNDFQLAASIIDPFIKKAGRLNGLIIHTKSFPGWDSFTGLLSHLRFVKDHHKKVFCVAFVTNSALSNLAETVGSHFVNAKIKSFQFQEIEKAKSWIISNVAD